MAHPLHDLLSAWDEALTTWRQGADGALLLEAHNPAASDLLGLPPDAVGRPLHALGDGPLLDSVRRVLHHRCAEQLDLPGERRVAVRPLCLPHSVAVHIRDVSDPDQAHLERIIAHDLEEPLRVAGMYAQLLCRGPRTGEVPRAHLDTIQRAIHRMYARLDGVLTLSRAARAPLTLHPVDLGTLLADRLAHHPAPPHLSRGPLPVVLGDPDRLGEVLDHLLTYAADHPVRLVAAPLGAGWQLTWTGLTGRLPSQAAKRAFLPFRPPYPGELGEPGVHLAVCELLIRRHGGRAWLTADGEADSQLHLTLRAP